MRRRLRWHKLAGFFLCGKAVIRRLVDRTTTASDEGVAHKFKK
jgi:hypothetical protein